MLQNFKELQSKVATINEKTIGIVFAHDEVVIEALKNASKCAKLNFILIGDEKQIKKMIEQYKLDNCTVINEIDETKASDLAVRFAKSGQIDLIMKGLIDTKHVLKAVVNSENGIKEADLLSHVAVLQFKDREKFIIVSDAAMNITPDVKQKIEIINNAIWLTKKLGYSKPKVGLVSAVEKVNPKIKSTIDAQEIVSKLSSQQNYLIAGPMAIDNLVSKESAKHKGIDNPVAGDADILIFDNLDGGNIFYKACVFLAHAIVAGTIVGAKVPIILTSRADSSESKLNSILLGLVLSNK